MAIITTDNAYYSAIASAIRSKNGSSATYKPSEMADAVSAITGGGGITPAAQKDVNFYDYDGTCLYSFTLAEAAALSALPDAPDHSTDTIPLTFQEWNYTLAQINALTQKTDVGATYITTDGKTHLTIKIAELGRMVVPLYFSQTVANGVTIDWGDGSATQTMAGTGQKNTTHTYAMTGTYDITLDVASDCTMTIGQGTSSYCVLGSTDNNGKVYCNMLQSVRIGSRALISTYAFYTCYSLASITIPSSVTSIGDYAFQNCYSLASISIPSSVTSIGTYAFRYCYSLASISIPSGVTSIGDYAFYTCYSLASITIPSSVTSIGNYAFSSCYGVAHYYFYSPTPPTLGGSSAFYSIPADCIIHVPAASLNAYKTATNWSAQASKMVGDL